MYYIKIATKDFRCPVSRERVKRGDAYIEDEDGKKLHLNQLPKRKLIPLKQYKNGPEVAVKSH
jgi:hypothetical protein